MGSRKLGLRPQYIILGAAIAAGLIGGVLRVVVFSAQRDLLTASDSKQASWATLPSAAHLNPVAVPLLSSLENATPLRTTALVPASASQDNRFPTSAPAGRLDPFSPVTRANVNPKRVKVSPTAVSTSVSSQSSQLPAVPAKPIPLPASPNTTVTYAPQLPPVPTATVAPPPVPLPPIPVGTAPIPIAPPPGNLENLSPVDSIEVSGVIQLGNRAGIIVRESHEQTSRHVFPGDALANGQVILKSIDFAPQEPLIILEYQGQEYPRVVGSGGRIGLS